MTDAAKFVGDIPENYDRGLGPHIFEDYAADIARRAASANAKAVLELAAGTGIVSRKLRNALPKTTQLVVTDLNEPMLAIAKAKFKAGETISFKAADAMALPFEAGAFDLMVCQFGVMFFPDKIQSFREAKRVLRTGGRYLFNVWGQMAHNPYAQAAHDVTAGFFPANPPGFYRVPFGYHNVAAVKSDLAQAGFTGIEHEVLKIEKRVTDWSLFARGLVRGNPLITEINARATATADEIQAALVERLRQNIGHEPATMPLEAILFNARRD